MAQQDERTAERTPRVISTRPNSPACARASPERSAVPAGLPVSRAMPATTANLPSISASASPSSSTLAASIEASTKIRQLAQNSSCSQSRLSDAHWCGWRWVGP